LLTWIMPLHMSLIKVSSMTALFDSLRLLSRENEWHGPSDYFTAAKKCSARVMYAPRKKLLVLHEMVIPRWGQI